MNNSFFPNVTVNSQQILEAQDVRAVRDTKYGNIYKELDTDMRYVGDLGEIVLRDHLKSLNCKSQWLTDDVTGQSDFKIGNVSNCLNLEVKTVKRKGPPKYNYTAQITARHSKKITDGYFFLSYEFPTQTMYFLGYSQYEFFFKHAKYYGEGEFVHHNYQVRAGHEIYNIQLDKLYPAVQFFEDMSSNFNIN